MAQRAATPEDRRLFRTAALDRAVIVKHKLRVHEREWFVAPKSVATKLLIPIDPGNLTFGAHAILVDQKGYDEALSRSLPIDSDKASGERDRAVLLALNELPSLDPFLAREQLTRRGFKVADDYFDISPADIIRMSEFVKNQIVPLVSLCFGQKALVSQIDVFSQKLLSAELDDSMDPLRQTLKMDVSQFSEGVFCWKGFLYYKWLLKDVNAQLNGVIQTLTEVKPIGEMRQEETNFIATARGRICGAVRDACRDVQTSLLAYDQAFEHLTRRADPVSFRDFLLAAPKMFFDVGERLGAVQHIASFWRFRFPAQLAPMTMPAAELLDVLTDFEASLGLQDRGRGTV